MIDENDPIENWNKQLEKNKLVMEKLNNLKIKILHYKNSLGTDLTLELLNDSIWCDASKNGLVNLPNYEMFTTPDYRKSNGIVYSSKPLMYNGRLVDNFWMKFKDGKVIEFGTQKGGEILKNIINSDSNSCYLGECAIVENDSPVTKTGLVFDLILTRDDVSMSKLHPEVYLKVLELMNVKGDECLVFEDSLSGIEAANIDVVCIYDKYAVNDHVKIKSLTRHPIYNYKTLIDKINE